MAKKTKDIDLEFDTWRLQYPSTAVSWNLIGDPAYCQLFVGEAKNMLYRLKNRMNLAVPKLKSLQDRYSPEPGTTITVMSIFGQDFIEISTGVAGRMGGKASCSIVFIDIPLFVPPMRNPGEIKSTEVEGVDYFKTYYVVDMNNCSKCGEIAWEFLFRYLQSSPLDPLPPPPLPISTRIEWPIEPMHHHDYDADGLLLDHDGTDHTIYSLDPPAWGEVIRQGSDRKGTYILWKAYTESGMSDDYSRTGLGIMRLVARIKDESGNEICAQNERIEVDCCRKDGANRAVEIWWEDFGTCQPFIMYSGAVYNAICKAPGSIPLVGTSGLIWYACTRPQQPFYAIPEIKGSCLPLEWTLSGPIDFWGSKKNDSVLWVKCLDASCHAGGSITLTDRCGTVSRIEIKSCCSMSAPLELIYVTLEMGCGQQQDFWALGGCGPYNWSCTKGSINNSGQFTAPPTNPDCVGGDVMLTDCCGNSQTIHLEFACGVSGAAFKTCIPIICTPGPVPPRTGVVFLQTYDCLGNLIDETCAFYYGGTEWHETDCGDCGHYLPEGECAAVIGGSTQDIRSPDQKAAGCCPPQFT